MDLISALWQHSELQSHQPLAADPTLKDRYRGVLLGVAVGNLLGIPYEGTPARYLHALATQGPLTIDPGEKYAPWDDDLAQTVLLAKALLAGNSLDPEDLGARLLDWERENGRGMGNLTRRVLRELRDGTPASEAAQVVWQKDGRGPAGNGAVMRCSPVTLRWRRHPQKLVEETLLSAAITHYDPRCQWSAVAINVALALALDGKSVGLNMLAAALDSAGAPDTVGEAVRVVEGCSLEDLDLDDPNAMGYTLKAMQVGLWALAQQEPLQEALSRVVLAGGDTDTNAAVAGAVLGGIQSYEAIPATWLECVPEHDRLAQLAYQLLMQEAINT